MALIPELALQARVAPIGNALIDGIQAGQQIAQQPLQNKLLQQELEGRQLQADAYRQDAQMAKQQQLTKLMPVVAGHLESLSALPFEQRAGAHAQFEAQIRQLGYPVDDTPDDLSDEGLKQAYASVSGFLPRQAPITPYQRENLDLQSRRLDEASADRAESRAFRQQQLDAQTANQQALNDIRQQQADTSASIADSRRQDAQAKRDAAAEKSKVANTGLDQELISLEGVLADVNRAEELLKNNGNLTGPLVGKTPNFSAEAQELESLSQALGIGALQQFKGATSEKELAAALRSGLSMTSDAAPNLKRLAAQKAVIQRNIDRIRGLRGGKAPAAQPNTFQSSSGIQFTVE